MKKVIQIQTSEFNDMMRNGVKFETYELCDGDEAEIIETEGEERKLTGHIYVSPNDNKLHFTGEIMTK